MLEENEITLTDDADDFAEEISLQFDTGQDPDAVWEWDGHAWIAVAV
jgi:hypothetical protein